MDTELAGISIKDFDAGSVAPKDMGLTGIKISDLGAPREAAPEKPSEFDYPLRDWEKDFAAKHDLMYPLARTIADIVPVARYIFPSARDALARKELGGQVLELGLEALSLVPAAYLGKGIKLAGSGITSILGKAVPTAVLSKIPGVRRMLPLEGARPVWETLGSRSGAWGYIADNAFADGLMADVAKYEHKSVTERLMAKYSLQGDEAEAVLKGQRSVWRPSEGRAGGWTPETSDYMKSLFTKDGTLLKDVSEDIKKWTAPREVQELNHYLNQANKVFAKVTGGTEYTPYQVFQTAASRVFGEAGQTLRLDNVGLDELGQMMRDVLEHGTSYRKAMDISAWSQIKPTRKVFGSMDAPWGAYDKFYKPVKNLLKAANIAEVNYVRVWHGMLAGKNFEGKPLLEVSVNKLGQTKLVENYTAKELENAGKLATDIDLAQSTGKGAGEVQALMNAAPLKVQTIAKTLHEWYDWMYADFTLNRTKQLFEDLGMTAKGTKAIEGIFSRPGGVADMINGALRAGNNMDFRGKQIIVENTLSSLKQLASTKNLDWFTDKTVKTLSVDELKELGGKIKNLKQELTFRKDDKTPGFTNYLENYTARVPKESIKPWTVEGGIPSEMRAAFTKARTGPEPAYDIKVDIPGLISARARMQSKDLYLYPHMDGYRDFVAKLPTNLKDYSTHWLNRLLGVPSPVDVKAARFLSRFSLKGWDERKVVDVAQKINDLVYMGGIGFKPFSAMRNFIQVPLMVPADMGGIKDVLWLAPGMKKSFEPSTREFIRGLGVIQEYAPDLAYNLKVSKHGEGTLDKVRDFSMWMFKNSEYFNRYWTGSSAMAKWEHYMTRLGQDGVIPYNKLDAFKSRLGLNSREAWVRKEMDDLLSVNTPESFLEAKKLFTTDVVNDSQFIYGIADSPLIGYKWGAPGRVSLVFQTWWMNYADELGKWLFRTPETGGKLVSATNERLFTFMLSSAISYEIMEPMWGAKSAVQSIGTGPLPLSLSIPPTWKPIFDGARLIADAGALLTPWGDVEATRKQMVQMIKDSAIFIPGGIQGYQIVQGARKEGLEGVLKSIIKYNRDKPKED